MNHAASEEHTTFLFVRHAQTLWNQEQRHTGSSEVGLAPAAERQIALLTRQLIKEPIVAIYTSPLSRCVLTIQHVADILACTPELRNDLKERHLGSWEGQSPRELLPLHPGYHFPESAYNGDFRIPGAEPLEQLEGRIRDFLREVSDMYPGKTLLVSTHSGVIWTIQHRIASNPLTSFIWPGNCSITTVVSEGRHFSLKSVEITE